MTKCEMKCEIFSRVVGYHRPVQNWNKGKKEEFRERVPFKEHTGALPADAVSSDVLSAPKPSISTGKK